MNANRGRRTWAGVALLLAAAAARADVQGFSLPKEDDAFTAGLEDFTRYCGKKQWDAAFRAISKVFDQPLKGFSGGDDGVLLPSRLRVRQALLTLPADGLTAYRLYFDAQAKKLYDTAVTAGSDDRAPLQKVVDQFFLTGSGATAADRLADAEFEAGDFAAAAERWRMILDQYPDPPMPAVRLLAKRATALARLGRTAEAAAVAKTAAEKYPDAQLSFGGRPQPAAEYFASLSAAPATAASPATRPADADAFAGAPDTSAEAWQTTFLPDAIADEFKNALQQTGWYRYIDSPDTAIPPACTDGKRVYVVSLGVAFAMDAATGKLAWRTDKFTRLQGQGMMYVETGGDNGTAVAAGAGHVYAVGAAAPSNGNGQRQFGMNQTNSLACLDPATGKLQWSTSKGTYSDWNFLGAPVVLDGVLYAVAVKNEGGSAEQMVALDPDKGTSLFTAPLGTAVAFGGGFIGQAKVPPPLLKVIDGTLYVLTNDGALLAFDPASRGVKWALRTEGQNVVSTEGMIIFSDDTPQVKVEPPGELVAAGGLLYLKEAATHTLYAVDPAVPKLLWKRPLESEVNVAADRGGRLITIGTAVEAIDPTTHALLWSTAVQAKTGKMRPVFDGNRMLIRAARGFYEIDTATGDVTAVRRGVDRDAVGGDLLVAGDKLVCVGNRAVTAYRLTASK